MSFPAPTDQALATVNGITYIYSVATNTWTRQSQQVGNRVTTSTTAPATPAPGDIWYNPTTNVMLTYIYDGVNYWWVDRDSPSIGSGNYVYGDVTSTGNVTAQGNINTAASVNANTVTANTLTVAGNLSVLGNITTINYDTVLYTETANIIVANTLTVSGNANIGNLVVARGNISTAGNLTLNANNKPVLTLIGNLGTSSGYVGIGTVTPQANLHLVTPSRTIFVIEGANSTSSNGGAVLQLKKTLGNTTAWIATSGSLYGDASEDLLIAANVGVIKFGLGSGYTEAARIDTGGNLLINTNTAKEKLTLNGSLNVQGSTYSYTGQIAVPSTGTYYIPNTYGFQSAMLSVWMQEIPQGVWSSTAIATMGGNVNRRPYIGSIQKYQYSVNYIVADLQPDQGSNSYGFFSSTNLAQVVVSTLTGTGVSSYIYYKILVLA